MTLKSMAIDNNDVPHETASPSRLIAGALALSLMGIGALGYEHGKAFYDSARLGLIRRVLSEEMARQGDIAALQGEPLRKKALQLRIENEDLRARLVDILAVAEGGTN